MDPIAAFLNRMGNRLTAPRGDSPAKLPSDADEEVTEEVHPHTAPSPGEVLGIPLQETLNLEAFNFQLEQLQELQVCG